MIKEEVKNIASGAMDAGSYLKENGLSRSGFFKDGAELAEILNFYEDSDIKLCQITGSFGTFKSKLAGISLQLLDENVLIFRYECFEATTLDDIFLSLFADLRTYCKMGRISAIKIETNSLTKKINSYLTHISAPCVFVFDSFECLNANPENHEEIKRFVQHLVRMNKFKVLVISRKNEEFSVENQKAIELKPFNQLQMGLYLEASGINAEQEDLFRLFQATKGNTSQISLTVNIISILKTSLKDFIEEFEVKRTSYGDFLLQKLTSFVPEALKKSVSLLALAKIGLSKEFLIGAGFFTLEQLNYLIDRKILSFGAGYVYMKGYLKQFWLSSVSLFEKQELHKYLYDFFESQLPLKPAQRIMPLSRTTMREQIAYHSSFLSDKPGKKLDTSYLGYVNSNFAEWSTPEPKKERPKSTKHERRERPARKESRDERKKSLEKYELTQNELALLGLPVDLSSGTVPAAAREQHGRENPVPEKSALEFFHEALNFQQNHEYQDALDAYDSAVHKITGDAEDIVPEIFKNASECALKLNKIDDSVKYLDSLYDFYYEKGKNDDANEVLLEIAGIYKNSYRFLKAKDIYERFINSKLPVSHEILAYAHIGLAQIADDSSDSGLAAEHYRKAFSLIDPEKTGAELSEAYFKYALLLDDASEAENAMEFYQKSVQACDDFQKNPYLSSAYTNIAEICAESGDERKSFKYFAQALKIDSELANYDGIYYLCEKLAQIAHKIRPDLELNFVLKGLGAAKHLQDRFYIVNSYLRAGDCYFAAKNCEKALKAYLSAKDSLMQGDFDKNELAVIEKRLSEVKNLIPPADYERVLKGIKK